MERKNHPCFDRDARHRFARVHLPVAPKCNVQCNYCNRKHDCVNESRPGVTSVVLSPGQSLAYLQKVMARGLNVSVAGIAGPGDPFANPHETLETLRLVRKHFPELLLCVASNGLSVLPYVDELARLGVSHVTITVNTVDPAIGARIYSWVRQGTQIYRGREGAAVLLSAQRVAIRALLDRKITVKVNTIIIPGVNDEHIGEVAKEMAAMGVSYMNALPVYPAHDTVFENLSEPDAATVARIRREAGAYLAQMEHCTRCRADAAGLLGETTPDVCMQALQECAAAPLKTERPRPFVAVASMEGALVNLHLGEADYLLIYRPTEKGGVFVEARQTPAPGTGMQRWTDLACRLDDCSAVLVSSAGAAPREVLQEQGVRVIVTDGLIADALETIARGRTPRPPAQRMAGCGCGASCKGAGTGCG
jgi:nitrogen fixation protein NifB